MIRLLADAMLGQLAKWLRILGYDTAYLVDTDDYALMRLARAEDRVILTRDRGLATRRGVNALLVEGESVNDQLRQIWLAFGPPADRTGSRCPVCNKPLTQVEPDAVADRVPRYVRRTHTHFSVCRECDRVYWRGTHWRRMQAFIDDLQDEIGSDTMSKSNDLTPRDAGG